MGSDKRLMWRRSVVLVCGRLDPDTYEAHMLDSRLLTFRMPDDDNIFIISTDLCVTVQPSSVISIISMCVGGW